LNSAQHLDTVTATHRQLVEVQTLHEVEQGDAVPGA